ncbi:hypothetical protein EK21DRAFT_113548 [Setomelanomma holmii]|uniref:Uncharacterized protein n=1 Tax=Setomelanomma holmii TaxID=210430 RepID=A0A9P4H639_9PLEO|nr:hypothetical protein EK21DRAFT_113548 [Setomelanomma holmii]
MPNEGPPRADQAMIQKRGKGNSIVRLFNRIFCAESRRDYEAPTVSPLESCPPKASKLYCFETPITSKSRATPSSSPTIPPTTADDKSLLPPFEAIALTSPDSVQRETSTESKHDTAVETDEYKKVLIDLRDAEKILQRRHAAMKHEAKMPAIKTRKPSFAIDTSKKGDVKAHVGSASLPPSICKPSYHRHRQAETAAEACEALQRRSLMRDLAYKANSGCENAITAVEELNAHIALTARNQDDADIPDLIFNFEGTHISASKLGTVEHTWMARVNASRKLQSLAARKHLGAEDLEVILAQLFPLESSDILQSEHYDIFVTGLGVGSIITSGEAKKLVGLGVSHVEFEKGARWTGASSNPSSGLYRHDPSNLAIFEIPKLSHCDTTLSDLYSHPRTLIEAAVYDQKFWKGYFFPNAQTKLCSFYEANQLQSQGLPIPPSLTDYKRPWTYREIRLLQRGYLICQGYWDVEELSTYLFHRVTDSGLSISNMPEILALHPEHDEDFANEEEQRLSEMETSTETFESLKKKEMTRWERIKMAWKKWLGYEGVVEPFDPFAEEYGPCASLGV